MRYGFIVPPSLSLSPAPPPSHTKTQLETAAASQQRAFLTLIRNGDCSCRLITAWDSAVQSGSSVAQCGSSVAQCGIVWHSGSCSVWQGTQWWAAQSKGTTLALCFSNRTLDGLFDCKDDDDDNSPPPLVKANIVILDWQTLQMCEAFCRENDRFTKNWSVGQNTFQESEVHRTIQQ